MPKPKYIVCAESVAQDKTTNMLSCFNILEGFTATAEHVPDEKQAVRVYPMKITCVAVWERTDEDREDQEFEFEQTVAFPGAHPKTLSGGRITIPKRYHRLITTLVVPGPPKLESGDIVFASRIKRPEANDWISQEFNIPLEVIPSKSGD